VLIEQDRAQPELRAGRVRNEQRPGAGLGDQHATLAATQFHGIGVGRAGRVEVLRDQHCLIGPALCVDQQESVRDAHEPDHRGFLRR
jgi:hypothetical protein